MSDDLPSGLVRWCQDWLGPCQLEYLQSDAASALLWRLVAADRRAILKIHQVPSKWEAELFAYQQWLPQLAEVPQLIAAVGHPWWAIIVSELPGVPALHLSQNEHTANVIWHRAGEWLAQLHHLPAGAWFGLPQQRGVTAHNHQPRYAAEVVQGTFQTWQIRAQQLGLDRRLVAQAEEIITYCLPWFAQQQPSCCHGDYRPRNWLIDAHHQWLGVIDFEHMRWDIRLNDLAYWWDSDLGGNPMRRQALLAGYNWGGSTADERQMAALRINAWMARWVAGQAYGDEVYAYTSHAQLQRIVAEVVEQ